MEGCGVMRTEPKIARIISVVAEIFDAPARYATSEQRNSRMVAPRHAAMWLARELTDASLVKIGRAFGGRDHTTVAHACSRVSERISTDPIFASKIAECRNRILNVDNEPVFLGRLVGYDLDAHILAELTRARREVKFWSSLAER